MEKLTNYPYIFKVSGETIEVHKNMIRKITVKGIEEKVSLEGETIGAAYSEEADDYVIVIKYPLGIYIITKQFGWLGPFDSAEEITYDLKTRIPSLKGTRKGKPGIFPL